MPRTSPVDRIFQGAVALLFLALAGWLVADSFKNRGFRLDLALWTLGDAILGVLAFLSMLRNPGRQEPAEEVEVEEL